MRYAFAVLTIAMLAGCTSTRMVDPRQPSTYADLNEKAQDKTVRVLLAGGSEEVTGLHVSPDLVSYVNANGQMLTLPPSKTKQVTFVQRRRGALQGLGIGALVGAVTGGLIFAITFNRLGSLGWTRADFAVLGAAVFSPIAAPVGLSIGATRGSSRVYRFAFDEQELSGKWRTVAPTTEDIAEQ